MAGCAEAGDCRGGISARCIGIGRRPAVWREHQHGFNLAQAIQTGADPCGIAAACSGRGNARADAHGIGHPAACRGIEIELSGGTRIRFGPGVKPATLRAVLDALDRR